MKISNFSSPYFKGYDAVPIKTLHSSYHIESIFDEMQKVADKEGFEIKRSKYNGSFCQDFLTILEKDKTPYALVIDEGGDLFELPVKDMEKDYNMPIELIPFRGPASIAGGNFFLGKKPDGTKWMLIAETEARKTNKKEVSKIYGVDVENIHYIPLQDYHLDMSIRPLGYPYVLVNDPTKALKMQAKIKYSKTKAQEPDLKQFKREVEALEKAGFKPILIGGIHPIGVNFMNAVVNKHDDGTISYITCSSKTKNPLDTKLQRQFEKDLRRVLTDLAKTDPQAPKLRDIHFIEGEIYEDGNEMTFNILGGAGGIHCMHSEEPNFDVWG